MEQKLRLKIISSILNELKNENRAIDYKAYNIEYKEFVSILYYMKKKDLINNVSFAHASNKPTIAYYDSVEITEEGIKFLKDNNPKQKFITKTFKFAKPTGKFLAWFISTILTLAGVIIGYLSYIKPN